MQEQQRKDKVVVVFERLQSKIIKMHLVNSSEYGNEKVLIGGRRYRNNHVNGGSSVMPFNIVIAEMSTEFIKNIQECSIDKLPLFHKMVQTSLKNAIQGNESPIKILANA